MPRVVEMSLGTRSGRWEVIAPAPKRIANSGKTERQWLCRCECGTEKVIPQAKIRAKATLSCGCWRVASNKEHAAIVIGRVYGRLTIIAEATRYKAPKGGKPRRRWVCRCECGNLAVTVLRKLESGHTKSCGCRANIRHGYYKTRTYNAWSGMWTRCLRPSQSNYSRYGGRGITVCRRWEKFANFLADMGECPEGLTIDRIDNDGNYEPSNCRWATRTEQQRNRRGNHIVHYQGREMTIAEAVDLAGIAGRGRRNYVYSLVNQGVPINEAVVRAGGQNQVS